MIHHLPARRPVVLAAVVAIAAALLTSLPARAAEAPVRDGSSQALAAASCWEIKQIKPTATDGVYWLLTPQLQAPRRFYCDMTTDGGGWVLVGRGRNGWSLAYNGRGTSDEVADTITGQAAFSPKQLDSNVINALLGGNRFDQVVDQVRVRRAKNATGTSWQNVTMTFAKAERWTWALGAGVPVSSVSMDGVSGTNVSTRYFASDDEFRSFATDETANTNYVRGFKYGSRVIGSTDPTSYLYSSATGGKWAAPMSQVFIRPKLRAADVSFAAVPDAGTSASSQPAAPNNGSIPGAWGVTGLGAGGAGENSTEVQAFAQVGGTMFAGGNFTTVQKGASASGADRIAQPYLAAFDATTGDYLPSFKPPVLDNQVKALVALPGGRLAVGGEFTQVNGTARAGFVVVDARTGAVDDAWTTTIENRMSGGKVSVRALDVSGDYLYLGGAFTHLLSTGSTAYAKGAARIQISTRTADTRWNPELNGTATALDVSTDGTRVYLSGYFTTAQGSTADRAAAFSTASGAPRITPLWQPTFSTAGTARYQQAVEEVGDKVWLGGSQHSMFAYDRDTFALENAHVTKWGGDLQAIAGGDGLVFGGCHCENWNYSDSTDFDGISPGQFNTSWRFADSIYYLGAWNATTGDYVADFSPEMRARSGMGVWAIQVADDGTVWAGGSLISSVTTTGANQWVGGFVRYGMRPTATPATPTDLKATLDGTDATVSWGASTTSGVSYEVLRNDRVVATTSTRSAVLPGSTANDRLFVRAVDARGNRSASTAVVTPSVPVATTTFLPAGSSWSYRFDNGSAVPSGWQQSTFDASTWRSGAAPLGFGNNTVATNIDVPSGQTRAVVSYYRSSFDVAAGTKVGKVTLTTRADDGVAVYVNGTEVGRANLPTGPLSDSSYATSAPSTAAAVANPVAFDVPASLLHSGTNTVAVSVHSMWRATPNSSMDLSIEATSGSTTIGAPPAPPVQPTTLVAEKSTWSYLFSATTAPPATWTTSATGTQGWAGGAAPLGWGTGPITTNIDVPAGTTRGLTSYYRRTFDVADPAAFGTLTLTTRADDGIAVYVNGTEVGRSRLPQGALTSGTYATSAVSTTAALAAPVTFSVPPSLLTAGTNTIAVEVHSNYRATPSQSMDLTLVGKP